MVRLKDRGKLPDNVNSFYFNSTMVRLKEKSEASAKAALEFQFHYGTIKSQRSDIVAHLEARFQFHYGTIKRLAVSPAGSPAALFQFHYGTIKSIVH